MHMKHIKKLLAFAVVAVMMLSFCSFGAYAAATQDSGLGGEASITITLPTSKTAPTKEVTYKIYKVFDATSDGESDAISYTLVNGKTTVPTGFSVDTAGNVSYNGTGTTLTEADVAAIKAYITGDSPIYTATVAKDAGSVTITGLPYGYYYIESSTGSVVTVDSTNPDAEVVDKNVIPVVKKSAGTEYDENSLKAIAAVGTSQDYTAQIDVGKGTVNLVFTDTMTKQTYNGDAKVTVNGAEVAAGADTFAVSGAEGDASFTITFVNDYIAGLDDNTIITINYSGTITSDALSVDPATNTASITSGDGNKHTSEEIQVYNAKITVVKTDDKEKPLAGAGFVLAKTEGAGDEAKTLYYKLIAATDTAPASIEWVEDIEEATEYVTAVVDNKAEVSFTGLADGTYTLIEKTVPAGYNKLDDVTVTIAANDYTQDNLEQTKEVENKGGTEMPSTGGIGTTIFYVVGSILLIGAAVVLFTKKRVSRDF